MSARETIFSLHDDGLSTARIVRRTGYTRSTVDYHLTALGCRPVQSIARQDYQRHGRAVRAFVAAEDAFLLARRKAGWSILAIAKGCAAFGGVRAVSSVQMRLLKLAASE